MNQITKQIFETLKKIKKQYEEEGFFIVGLFGSYAQNGYDTFSDIDIAKKLLFLATYGIIDESNISKAIYYEKITGIGKSETKKRGYRFDDR